MPSTHTCIHIHVVFSTKERFPHIRNDWRPGLHEYLGGCARRLGATPLQIGGVSDHVHMLLGIRTTHTVADLVRELKKASTTWARDHDTKFGWQDGYGAFAVGNRDLLGVGDYIRTQDEHHRTLRFEDEYVALLNAEGVEYDPRFLW